jgi:16S rRNA processing protein RimM
VLLEVGRVVRPHGLRGEVVVELVTDRTERLAPGTRLRAGGEDLRVEAASEKGRRWLVSFEGVATLEAAESIRGASLMAEPIEDPEALWVHELIGSEVLSAQGCPLGRVVAVEANPASDLLVLEGETLVPLCFVVGRAPGRVVVDAPEGLLG